MNTDLLICHIKTEDFYSDIAEDVEARFNTSGYDKADAKPLPIGKNKKVIGLMKDELGGKIMTGFVALGPKSHAYRKLDNKEDTKCKGIKKCIVKKMNGLLSRKSINKTQSMFRRNRHRINTVEVNKVALNRDDDKWIVKNDGINTLVHGHNSLCWNPLFAFISLS